MKIIKKISRLVLIIVLLCATYLVVVILFGTVTNYQPNETIELKIIGSSNNEIIEKDTFSILSWNIGFCGLGAEMDFFYDGGKMVRPTSELIEKYTNGACNFLTKNSDIDFIILQEVDQESSRTKRQNEVEIISQALPGYSYSYADNYHVRFVPVPFTNPLGKVKAGQMNLSRMNPMESKRIAFQSSYAWPKNLFMLDRCFILSRFKLQNGKEIVVLNTHNSAYDTNGELRNAEIPLIRKMMLEEYAKGNYVVAGGDWNQNPPNFNPELVNKKYPVKQQESITEGYFPRDWNIVYDSNLPTNRNIETPLIKGETLTTVIDYFILSPNIDVLNIHVVPQNFKYSDHEAVLLRFVLRKGSIPED